ASGMSIGSKSRWPARGPLHAGALEIGSGERHKGILAKPIGVTLAQLRDLDDAQGEQLSRRVPVAVGSKTTPALLDGLPCLIEGVSQELHLVSVEGTGERVPRQHPEHALPSLNHVSATRTKISRVLKESREAAAPDAGEGRWQGASPARRSPRVSDKRSMATTDKQLHGR